MQGSSKGDGRRQEGRAGLGLARVWEQVRRGGPAGPLSHMCPEGVPRVTESGSRRKKRAADIRDDPPLGNGYKNNAILWPVHSMSPRHASRTGQGGDHTSA